MVIDIIAGLIDICIWAFLLVLFYRQIKEIKNRLETIEENIINTTKLFNCDAKNLFDISNAVQEIKYMLEDFHIEYKDIGKVLDKFNCPVYKIEFANNCELTISYDFKNIKVKDENKEYSYINWNTFKKSFETIIARKVEFKNEEESHLSTKVKEIINELDVAEKEIINELDVAEKLVVKPKKNHSSKKKAK